MTHDHARLRLEHLEEAINAHAIVSIGDPQGKIIYVNEKFCAISGYSEDELLGQNHRIMKSGVHDADFYRELWTTIRSGRVWRGEVCNLKKGGGLYWVEASIFPVLDHTGTPIEYISIRTDITELKAREGALVTAWEAADRASQAKSDFLSSMSHELRTPMNAIIGFAQMLEYDPQITLDQLDNVQEILKASHHLLDLINEVLDLAKIESGRIDLSMEGVDLASLIEDCRHLIQPLADTLDVRLALEPPTSTSVFADRVRLKQVLINLLSNGVKYNRQGGSVSLGITPGKTGYLRLSVHDTGQGIPPERLGDLFQPFNRLGAEFSNIEGSGIGLTITHRLVEMMGGEMGVESTFGVGSTFWLELAIASPETNVNQPSSEGLMTDPTQALTTNRTVLAIDDNPANLKLIAQVMGMRQYIHLVSAHTPELGIELALSHRPNLILLDINMPGMDGYQVLEIFKASPTLQSIPVIAITANAMPRDLERGMAAGFTDYITKPIDIERFLQVIDRQLSRSEGAR